MSATRPGRSGLAIAGLTLIAITCLPSGLALGQFDFEQPPISYSESTPNDVVAKLIKQLESGERELTWTDQQGWLPSLLQQLEISTHSQTLVFSKTSLQLRHISPQTPRAIYFNDEAYVGWVPGGELIEISAVDDKLGAVFYTLKQARSERPELQRDQSNCLTCHATSKTKRVPGLLVRSVFPSASGQPHYSLGSTTTSQETKLSNRFGGWYVTGDLGQTKHRGNKIAKNDPAAPFDAKPVQLDSLEQQFDTSRYLSSQSDVAALMLLEHQSQMHNLITLASYETRQAIDYQATMNRILDRAPDFESDSTQRRIQKVAEQLVQHLFFVGEAKLPSPIQPNPEFVRQFESRGPFDSKGRSLRQIDLRQRLLKYPCSYLIYSSSFDSLPDRVRDLTEERILDFLLNAKNDKRVGDKKAASEMDLPTKQTVLEILLETKPSLKARYERRQSRSAAGDD